MDYFEAHVHINAIPDQAYAYLLDPTRYLDRAKYLTLVATNESTGEGASYDLRFEWWFVERDIRVEVTATEPPRRIAFETSPADSATATWTINTPDDADTGSCEVRFSVKYDQQTVAAVDPPSFIPIDTVIQEASALVKREFERIIRGIAADLEGQDRPIDIRFVDSLNAD